MYKTSVVFLCSDENMSVLATPPQCSSQKEIGMGVTAGNGRVCLFIGRVIVSSFGLIPKSNFFVWYFVGPRLDKSERKNGLKPR